MVTITREDAESVTLGKLIRVGNFLRLEGLTTPELESYMRRAHVQLHDHKRYGSSLLQFNANVRRNIREIIEEF